jgi:hypothetical protein
MFMQHCWKSQTQLTVFINLMQCFIQAFAPGGWAPRTKRWAPRGNLTKKFFGGVARDPIYC